MLGPAVLYVLTQCFSTLSAGLGQVVVRRTYRSYILASVAGSSLASAVVIAVLAVFAGLALPQAWTGPTYYEGQAQPCYRETDIDLTRTALACQALASDPERACHPVTCPRQGIIRAVRALWHFPIMHLNGLVNIVYVLGELYLFQHPYGIPSGLPCVPPGRVHLSVAGDAPVAAFWASCPPQLHSDRHLLLSRFQLWPWFLYQYTPDTVDHSHIQREHEEGCRHGYDSEASPSPDLSLRDTEETGSAGVGAGRESSHADRSLDPPQEPRPGTAHTLTSTRSSGLQFLPSLWSRIVHAVSSLTVPSVSYSSDRGTSTHGALLRSRLSQTFSASSLLKGVILAGLVVLEAIMAALWLILQLYASVGLHLNTLGYTVLDQLFLPIYLWPVLVLLAALFQDSVPSQSDLQGAATSPPTSTPPSGDDLGGDGAHGDGCLPDAPDNLTNAPLLIRESPVSAVAPAATPSPSPTAAERGRCWRCVAAPLRLLWVATRRLLSGPGVAVWLFRVLADFKAMVLYILVTQYNTQLSFLLVMFLKFALSWVITLFMVCVGSSWIFLTPSQVARATHPCTLGTKLAGSCLFAGLIVWVYFLK